MNKMIQGYWKEIKVKIMLLIFFVLLIYANINASALISFPNEEYSKVPYLLVVQDDDYGCNNENSNSIYTAGTNNIDNDCKFENEPNGITKVDGKYYLTTSTTGCIVRAVETDGGATFDNDCAWGLVEFNYIFDGTTVSNFYKKFELKDIDGSDNGRCLLDGWKWGFTNSYDHYICGDGFWLRCDVNSVNKGVILADYAIKEDFLYQCIKINDKYHWSKDGNNIGKWSDLPCGCENDCMCIKGNNLLDIQAGRVIPGLANTMENYIGKGYKEYSPGNKQCEIILGEGSKCINLVDTNQQNTNPEPVETPPEEIPQNPESTIPEITPPESESIPVPESMYVSLLNWQGKFYGCGLTQEELTKLNSVVDGVDNKAENCHHFVEKDKNSNYYCDITSKQWRDATLNYDGTTLLPLGTFINSEKSTSVKNSVRNGDFESGTSYWYISDNTLIIEDYQTKKSLHINKPAYISQPLPIDLTKKYPLSYYVNGDCDNFNIKISVYDSNSKTTYNKDIVTGSKFHYTVWTQLNNEIDLQLPPAEHGYYNTLIISCDSKPNLYIDDIQVTDDNAESKNCCPSDNCWDGIKCVSEGELFYKGDTANNKICISVGEWLDSPKKYNPIGEGIFIHFGYCNPNQCYYSANKDMDNNGCKESGIYIDNAGNENKGDNYCDNGQWTSRTKQIAMELLKFAEAKEPYALYCDDEELSLNRVPSTTKIEKACVIKYTKDNKEQVAVGMNLNLDQGGDINKILKEDIFEQTINVIVCNSNTPDEFVKCTPADIQFKKRINSFVYTRLENPTFSAQVSDFINSIEKGLDNFLKWILGNTNSPTQDEISSYLNTQQFDRLYVYKNGDKSIVGFIGKQDGKEFINIEYRGFSTNICEELKKSLKDIDDNNCKYQNNAYIVSIDNTQYIDNWQDLTSKLRPK